jgi:hypothetical protein
MISRVGEPEGHVDGAFARRFSCGSSSSGRDIVH